MRSPSAPWSPSSPPTGRSWRRASASPTARWNRQTADRCAVGSTPWARAAFFEGSGASPASIVLRSRTPGPAKGQTFDVGSFTWFGDPADRCTPFGDCPPEVGVIMVWQLLDLGRRDQCRRTTGASRDCLPWQPRAFRARAADERRSRPHWPPRGTRRAPREGDSGERGDGGSAGGSASGGVAPLTSLLHAWCSTRRWSRPRRWLRPPWRVASVEPATARPPSPCPEAQTSAHEWTHPALEPTVTPGAACPSTSRVSAGRALDAPMAEPSRSRPRRHLRPLPPFTRLSPRRARVRLAL
jgi:hypothetical protein